MERRGTSEASLAEPPFLGGARTYQVTPYRLAGRPAPMSSPHLEQHRKKRLLITLIVTGFVITCLAAVGIYGLVTGPNRQAHRQRKHPLHHRHPLPQETTRKAPSFHRSREQMTRRRMCEQSLSHCLSGTPSRSSPR